MSDILFGSKLWSYIIYSPLYNTGIFKDGRKVWGSIKFNSFNFFSPQPCDYLEWCIDIENKCKHARCLFLNPANDWPRIAMQ